MIWSLLNSVKETSENTNQKQGFLPSGQSEDWSDSTNPIWGVKVSMSGVSTHTQDDTQPRHPHHLQCQAQRVIMRISRKWAIFPEYLDFLQLINPSRLQRGLFELFCKNAKLFCRSLLILFVHDCPHCPCPHFLGISALVSFPSEIENPCLLCSKLQGPKLLNSQFWRKAELQFWALSVPYGRHGPVC